MTTARPNYLAAGVGVLLILGSAWLPIDPGAVRDQTVIQLARKAIKGVKPKEGTPPLAIQFRVEGGDVDRFKPLVTAPIQVVKQPDGSRKRQAAFAHSTTGEPLVLRIEDAVQAVKVTAIRGKQKSENTARLATWMALLPPLVALILAVAFRRVILALFTAVMTGAIVLASGNPLVAFWNEIKGVGIAVGNWFGAGASTTSIFGGVLGSSFKLQILGFTAALIGMIAVIARMGGTRGLVDALSGFARGPRSAQGTTAVMGIAIFFDDYANSLVVGTTGRSLTDRHKISREKLAYIVDSTAAPVAGVAVISTWIGYEVGLFDDLLGTLSAVPGIASSGYELFFQLLPMRFYCLFALALVFLGAWTSRDLGPMYHAEIRARRGGPLVPPGEEGGQPEVLEKEGVKASAWNAILPIGAVVFAISAWIVIAGTAELTSFSPFSLADWKKVFDTPAVSDNSALIMLWAALIGSVIAIGLALGRKLLTAGECARTYGKGIATLKEAAAILILAWSIKAVCDQLGTGTAIVVLVGDALPPIILPLAVFALSGVVAFATGTSWGTMALVLPVAAPLAATLSGEPIVVLACLGAVLDGAIWGDHCSPISDTTVLSSTASGCPHLAHVRTQIPYATLAMVAAGGAGYLGIVAGLPLWLAYAGGIAVMIAGLYLFGRNPNAPAAADT